MANSSRPRRVGEQVQRELARLIQFDIKDPRLGMVTVSDVRVSPDLSYAEVYFTLLVLDDADKEEAVSQAVKILNEAAGFLKTQVGRAIKLRIVPNLRFHYDYSIERGQKLESLIHTAVDADKKNQNNTGADVE